MRRLVAILIVTLLAAPAAARADEGTRRFIKVVVGGAPVIVSPGKTRGIFIRRVW